MALTEAAHEILVLFAVSSNEGSDKAGQLRRLTNDYAAHIHIVCMNKQIKYDQKLDLYCRCIRQKEPFAAYASRTKIACTVCAARKLVLYNRGTEINSNIIFDKLQI